ncbi:unnamed protein product, partial [Mesorhabditis belari]|uniref:Transcriptional coactivator p15 (PC4) C-terminal domain-containing protein n=1 Tax=Mesorhabditis belari TaxID=2138241 RepID=A0AAF3FFC2_9BILA
MAMSDSDSDHEVKKGTKKQKRKQEKESSSDEGVNDPIPVKKAKPTSSSNNKTKISGNDAIELGKMKFVTISQFSGRKFVDVREYYNDKGSGEMKPGKKGIALSIEQFTVLKQNIDEIEKMFSRT